MPNFTDYEVEYTNVKPWNGQNLGSGKMVVSIIDGASSIRAAIKKTIEKKINSLRVRVDSFKPVVAE